MSINEGYELHLKCDNKRGANCPNKCDTEGLTAASAWRAALNYGWRHSGLLVFCSVKCERDHKRAVKMCRGAGYG